MVIEEPIKIQNCASGTQAHNSQVWVVCKNNHHSHFYENLWGDWKWLDSNCFALSQYIVKLSAKAYSIKTLNDRLNPVMEDVIESNQLASGRGTRTSWLGFGLTSARDDPMAMNLYLLWQEPFIDLVWTGHDQLQADWWYPRLSSYDNDILKFAQVIQKI